MSRKIPISGHFVDNKLKYPEQVAAQRREQKRRRSGQLDLFIDFEQNKIDLEERAGVEISLDAIGIKLTRGEEKMINCLNILRERGAKALDGTVSEGQTSIQIREGARLSKLSASMLTIRPGDLYREYCGGAYSGKEVANIKQTLRRLEDKKYLMIYKRATGTGKQVKTDLAMYYEPLIKIGRYLEGATKQEEAAIRSQGEEGERITEGRGELMIHLNPIFTDQIEKKCIYYPEDINKRTEIACGGKDRVTTAATLLRDYFMRHLSVKGNPPTVELNRETLIYTLGLGGQLKNRNSHRINERLDFAIRACCNLGIIEGHELTKGAEQQPKYTFTLNPDWAR